MNTTPATITLRTMRQLRATKHVPGVYFHCHACKTDKPVNTGDSCSTGYGYDKRNRPTCFACCGKNDAERMRKDGKITLYLTMKDGQAVVANWPGSLSFRVNHSSHGKHNIARTRHDVWFVGPDSYQWHGVNIGKDNQICRCTRTKV